MLFAESYARLLLVLHTGLAAALVAVSTHLVVWMRGFPRGQFQRLNGVRRLARISAILFAITFVVGNLIYPVYKVRVRAEYLDQPGALLSDYQDRAESATYAAERYADTLTAQTSASARTSPSDAQIQIQAANLPREAAKVARWFDVKEHWLAFGMVMAIACAVIVQTWNPRRDGQSIAAIVFLMAVAAALSTWLGAVIGVVVSSYRAIGGL